MREVTEILWIVNLLNSELSGNTFKIVGGDKSEFEKFAKAPTNNSEFTKWFRKMIELGCIEYKGFEEGEKGHPKKIYEMNYGKMLIYLKEFEIIKEIKKVL